MLPLADPELLAQAIEYLPDALVIVDKASNIVLINRQTEVIFGYPRAALLGKPIETLMPERFRERHRGHFAMFTSDPHVRPMGADLPLVAVDRDGEEFPVAINLSPLIITEGTYIAAVIRRKETAKPFHVEDNVFGGKHPAPPVPGFPAQGQGHVPEHEHEHEQEPEPE